MHVFLCRPTFPAIMICFMFSTSSAIPMPPEELTNNYFNLGPGPGAPPPPNPYNMPFRGPPPPRGPRNFPPVMRGGPPPPMVYGGMPPRGLPGILWHYNIS